MGLKTVFLLGFSVVLGEIWIPEHELGFVYKGGKPQAQIKIDLFVDLLCPDSKTAFLVLMKVADGYQDDQVRLKTHLAPLPYHMFAFMASKTVHAISKLTHDKETYNWIQMVFSHMSLFSGKNTQSKTGHDVMINLIDLSKTLKLNESDFKGLCLSDVHVEEDTRLGCKYSSSRGVHSVPWFMINDVAVYAETWTEEEWKKQIDRLLTLNKYHK